MLINARILMLCLMLGACGGTTQTLVPVMEPKAPVSVPTPQPLTMNPVNIKVMNSDDLKAAANDAQKANTFVFTFDQQNYQNLSLNLVEIKRFIDEQAAIIKMLKAVVGPDQPKSP